MVRRRPLDDSVLALVEELQLLDRATDDGVDFPRPRRTYLRDCICVEEDVYPGARPLERREDLLGPKNVSAHLPLLFEISRGLLKVD